MGVWRPPDRDEGTEGRTVADGGVLGPCEEATEVYGDWESALELVDDPMEPTRGETVPDEYACWAEGGKGNDGSRSFMYEGR